MKEELRPPHKHHPRLVLFCIPSSIVRLRKAIQFPYGFGYEKGEIGVAMTAGNTSGHTPRQCDVSQWRDGKSVGIRW